MNVFLSTYFNMVIFVMKALEEEEPVLAAEFVIPKPSNWTGPTDIKMEINPKILASLQMQVTNAAQINPCVR